jgi:hypothetical protein
VEPTRSIPYRKPQLGRDYWIKDNALSNAKEIAARCLAHEKWTLGFPFRRESWPGKRFAPALLPEELNVVEEWTKTQLSATRLWQEASRDHGLLDHNSAQLVGETDGGPRPHTDSRNCRYAGVLYLTPGAPESGGTSFFRLNLPSGTIGGNTCPPQFASLGEALGVPALPLSAWKEDVVVPNVFNRLLVYRADLVHSASQYFGFTKVEKRLTVVFFWMAS